MLCIKKEKRPDHWDTERSYTPAEEKDENNCLLNIMDSIYLAMKN